MAILDNVRAAFTRKQAAQQQSYAEIVAALANDQTVSERDILESLESNNKTPDDLDAAVEIERERIRLGGEITRLQALIDDVVVARREETKLTGERDAELQAVRDKYEPRLTAIDSRIRRGEAARSQIDTARNRLSQLKH